MVTDGVNKIRNLNISKMTIIEGEMGITFIDPMLSTEPEKDAVDIYKATRGKKAVVGVVNTHTHV
ncbi:MBL fold metallo-hydrolase, partial [Enterobacter hormaechei]